MRNCLALAGALVLTLSVSTALIGQAGPPQGATPGGGQAGRGGGRQAAGGPDPARVVEGGGVFAPGWMGRIDAAETANGQVLNNSKLALENGALHVTTGPSATYWNPANRATGNYTVKATFNEPKYMDRNSHPHPYGIVIGGNDLGTPQQSYLYCAAYGNGMFIVRGFGPSEDAARDTVFQMNGRGQANEAVKKAAGPGQSVTQEIAVTVKADAVECAINGAVVATYPKTEVVAEGKLKSTDGVYGIRFAHNTEAIVTGLGLTK